MIVHSIKLGGWRCFIEEVTIAPFSDGLNVVHAPNGKGKSTLLEALCRALLDGHKVTGKDIDAIRPWGRQLTPKVAVEFNHDGQEYRISKQYLDHPTSLLERIEGGRFRSLAEGAAADTEARKVLSANPPGRGLSKDEHSGLAQILWASQGNLALDTLSGDVVADIRNMLGAQVSAAGTGAIETQIEKRYLQFFTRTGKLKVGRDAPYVSHLADDLAQAEAVLVEAREEYRKFEELSRRVEDSRNKRQQTRQYLDEIQKTLGLARKDAEAYRKLVSEKDKRTNTSAAAEARNSELRNRIKQIEDAKADFEKGRKSLETLKKDSPLTTKELKHRELELARWKTAVENAKKGQGSVDKAVVRAKAARRFVDGLEALERLDDTIGKVRGAQTTLRGKQKARNGQIAPDDKTLKAIRKAISDRDASQLLLDSALITLEIAPLRDGSAEVLAGEQVGSLDLKEGVPARILGSPEIVAELPGIARIRASGPTGSAEEYRKKRTSAEERLNRLTTSFGTSDIDPLEAMNQSAKELSAEVKTAETTLETLVSDQSLDDFLRLHATLKASLDQVVKEHPDWEAAPPDAQALESETASIRAAYEEQVAECEEDRDKAQGAWSTAKEGATRTEEQLTSARDQLERLENQLTTLTRENKPIDELATEAKTVLMEWDAARTSLGTVEEQLKKYVEDPRATVEQLETQLAKATSNAQSARESEVRAETDLQRLSAEGPYSALNRAEEKVAQLKEDLVREQLHVDAIGLLHKTVNACRSEAIAAVARPVENNATQTLQRIAGLKLGRIQIDESFTPSGVVPDGHDQTVELVSLSGGEREQLYLATRLALADTIGAKERQLVVIDDVLTSTDSGRLARIQTILEESAERFQILILTCHEERYLGLKGASFIDLEEVLNCV